MLEIVDVPKVAGMPDDHVSKDCARPGVPVAYLTPGLFSNTHPNHTVCPEATPTGFVSVTVCHPAVGLIIVADVTPILEAGEPDWSEYTPSNKLPVPPLW